MIAKKIGHDERYVWNRLRLLEAIPEVQQMLRAGIIGVEHAEVLAKLKESDQKRAIGRQNGGLFEMDTALEFDDRPRLGSTAFDRLKAVSVRELKQWVATHIRLDLEFAAKAAPLDFGESAQRVAAAQEADERGKTPIPIVFSHMCPYEAGDRKERTYGASAWKKAQNAEGQPTCDHARIGFVVAGQHYGESFLVCINRDKCLVHWKDAVKAKEKKAARSTSSGTTAAKAPSQKQLAAEVRRREKDERAQAARELALQAWEAMQDDLEKDVLEQIKKTKTLNAKQAEAIEQADVYYNLRHLLHESLGKQWFKTPVTALLSLAAFGRDNYETYDEYVKEVAAPLGLDLERLEAIRDKHTPKAETPAPKKATKA
jgi:hypothetical protein